MEETRRQRSIHFTPIIVININEVSPSTLPISSIFEFRESCLESYVDRECAIIFSPSGNDGCQKYYQSIGSTNEK